MEVLGPLPLHDRPKSFDGVELAAVGGKEVLFEVFVVNLIQLLRVGDPQVVKHYHHSPSLALVLHSLHEVHEEVGVVALHEDLEVHEAAHLADRIYDCNRWASRFDEGKLHARGQPAFTHLLPEIEGGIVDVDYLA